MNCDCIAKNEKRLFDSNREYKNKKVADVSFEWLAFFPGEIRGFSTFGVAVEGVKRRYPLNVLWSYCPFCGKKACLEKENNINE